MFYIDNKVTGFRIGTSLNKLLYKPMRGDSRESTSLQRHSSRRWTAFFMYSASIPEIRNI